MIRKLNKKYVEKILDLHKKSIFSLWNKLNRNYSISEIRKFIEKVFERGKIYGFFEREILAGAIGVEPYKKDLEISFLLVFPNYQKRGIGKSLMLFIEKNKKIKKIILRVLIKNPAVTFYKKMDYIITSKKGKKYIMEKILK